MINNLYHQLKIFQKNVPKPFAGLGLIVTNNTEGLPIYPIHDSMPNLKNHNLVDNLIELSKYTNPYHDGFHILSSNLEIKHVSQYFFPTPPKEINRKTNNMGIRYFVAKIGSMIPNIICVAIVSDNYGICIFRNGKKEEKYD